MLKNGINDCDNAVYHGDRTYISSSGLKLILEDPIQYYNKYINPDKQFKSVGSTAMDLGSYVHSLILEPENTDADFAIWDGIKRGDVWKEFERENKHKIIITQKNMELGQLLCGEVLKNKCAVDLLDGGKAELTYCTNLLGVDIKVRADKINLEKNYIVDVKTTSKPLNKEALEGSIASLHYDLSAALYIDCFREVNKVDNLEFYFLFVNTKDSLDVAIFKASDILVQNGRRKYRKAIKKLLELRKTGLWKKEGIEEIGVPYWSIIPEEFEAHKLNNEGETNE
jgi:hypothetical protein